MIVGKLITVNMACKVWPTLRNSGTENNSKHLFIASSVNNSLKNIFRQIVYTQNVIALKLHYTL